MIFNSSVCSLCLFFTQKLHFGSIINHYTSALSQLKTLEEIQDGHAPTLGKPLAGHPPGFDLSGWTELSAARSGFGPGLSQQSDNRPYCVARGRTGDAHTRGGQSISHCRKPLLGLLRCHGPVGSALQLQRWHLPVLLRLLFLPLLLPVQNPQFGPDFLFQL